MELSPRSSWRFSLEQFNENMMVNRPRSVSRPRELSPPPLDIPRNAAPSPPPLMIPKNFAPLPPNLGSGDLLQFRKKQPKKPKKPKNKNNKNNRSSDNQTNAVIDVGTATTDECPCCNSKIHKLPNCQSFSEMNYVRKWSLLKKFSNICTLCLMAGHNKKFCESDVKCCLVNDCHEKHHSLLHPPGNSHAIIVKKEIIDLASDEDDDEPKSKYVIKEIPDTVQNNKKGKNSVFCSLCESNQHLIQNCPDLFCFKCKQYGHFKKDCKKPDIEKCSYCQMDGHSRNKCPIDVPNRNEPVTVCSYCGVKGHHCSLCPEIKCRNCGTLGHMSSHCKQPKVITCLNCDMPGHHIRECPYVECKKCGGSGHWERDCTNSKGQFRGQNQVQNQNVFSVDYHHLRDDNNTSEPFPRPKGSLLAFFGEKVLAQSRAITEADEMMYTWRLAGHNEDSLYNLIKQSRPPNKTQLRLLLIKELSKANNSFGVVPLNISMSTLLDETIEFFMPHDRVNLIDGKLNVNTQQANSSTKIGNQTSSLLASTSRSSEPRASTSQMSIGGPSSSTLSSALANVERLEKLNQLSSMLDLHIGPPSSQDRQEYEERVDDLENLRIFILSQMRAVAENFGITEGYIQKTSLVIIKLLAITGFTVYKMKRHLSSYGPQSLKETISTKIRMYEPNFPKGLDTEFIQGIVLNYLNESSGF